VALVRRGAVVGPQGTGHTVAAAVGHAQVPRKPGAPPMLGPHTVGGDGGQAAVAAVAGPVSLPGAPGGDAAAVPSMPANAVAILLSFGLVGAGGVAAWQLGGWHPVSVFRVGNQMSAFGVLFVFAAAVERLLEPLSQWLPGRRTKDEYERMVAAVANRHPTMTLADVAGAKARWERARANRTVLVWGLATAVSTVASAAGGFYLLRMLSANADWQGVATWVDALVTGLVVGSGTKPLHDLISRVQKGKEQAEDPAPRA
jgi:hypothetical protein